uniref:Uncharacterized protein n=1 Tax=Candidatus Kentrum sp. UNK TaxID=2126344 RepID=A0A451AQP1_9GAMM|nr:MAG: hypothetical protein BECKUNK1418G_GA0071005_12251 [Candidatus Kentron sp. UNK]
MFIFHHALFQALDKPIKRVIKGILPKCLSEFLKTFRRNHGFMPMHFLETRLPECPLIGQLC